MIDIVPSLIANPAHALTAAEKHPIRAKEDALFEEWVEKRPRRNPFTTDGCAVPEAFEKSRCKIVFVLKERNWDYTIEAQRAHAEQQSDLSERLTELRADRERETFDGWWTLMAQWAEALLSKEPADWREIQSRFEPALSMTPEENDRGSWIRIRNKESLGKCACVQLKKAPGGGTMNKADFDMIVREDRDLILRQFSIYAPDFIVSCGSSDNWNVFRYTLFPKSEVKWTRNGIQYFIASSPDNGLGKTAVINFGHPSMRVNNSLWGVLALGLREALDEISLSGQLRQSSS